MAKECCSNCGTKEGLIHAKGGIYCHDCLDEIIEDEIKLFDGDTSYTSNAICPHCGSEDNDSWEIVEDGESICSNCGRNYYVERHIDVTYSTTKC